MRRPLWVAALLVAAASAPAMAQPLRLTMQEAVARATAGNYEVTAGRKEVNAAQANVERSKALLPSNPFFSAGSQHTTRSGVGLNYTFLLSQEVEIGGQRRQRMTTAKKNLEVASWDLRSIEVNTTATVKAAFIDVLLQAERLDIARKSAAAAAQFSTNQSQKRASLTERIDRNNVEIQALRARRDIAAAEQARDNALATLRRLLRVPVQQELELIGAPAREVQPLPPAAELVSGALRQRPDVIALQNSVERAGAQFQLAKRQGIPNLTFSATVSQFEGDTLAGGDIGFPIPLFQRRGPDMQEAVSERERAAAQLDDLRRAIEQEVTDARRACEVTGIDLQTLAQEIMPRSEENVELEQRMYERNEVTMYDLMGIQSDLLNARRDYVDAVQAYNNALIELERVTAGALGTPTAAPGQPSARE